MLNIAAEASVMVTRAMDRWSPTLIPDTAFLGGFLSPRKQRGRALEINRIPVSPSVVENGAVILILMYASGPGILRLL